MSKLIPQPLKNTQWGKDSLLSSINGFGETGYLHAKEYIWPIILCHSQKNSSKWIKDLHLGLENIKLLE